MITGGSKGIGLACARAFALEGARVAIASRSLENLERARQALACLEEQTDASDADWALGIRAQARALVTEGEAAERGGPVTIQEIEEQDQVK